MNSTDVAGEGGPSFDWLKQILMDTSWENGNVRYFYPFGL